MGALFAVGSGLMTYMSGQQQAASYDAQAQAQEQNAAIAERNRPTAAAQAARQQQEDIIWYRDKILRRLLRVVLNLEAV